MRAKDTNMENWSYLSEDEPFQEHTFACNGPEALCTYFPVGYVPELHYDMYDVAILVKPSDALAKMEHVSINFHMAWVNPEYTAY